MLEFGLNVDKLIVIIRKIMLLKWLLEISKESENELDIKRV